MSQVFVIRKSDPRKRLQEMNQFRNEVEMRNFEETKYLRRMSQNKFV
ncbi:unnamed protein product [Wuchereria bancrofti]|uniref:Uncharacterized protein n=1 Tax=Wuchereria bancrofti TaxID=6293 RepID=A0A3P7EIU2_WUCBA|nr:unnamed protein product [Wuchereria bancrofti]